MRPNSIKVKEKSRLEIVWDTGEKTGVTLDKLRRNCPCATCKEEKDSRGEKYFPVYLRDQTQIKKIAITGNYAITIIWEDGHSTGIYEFPYLRGLSL
ncbi:MAG: DUF971 domain-containing protein [Ignavibacteriaceae bacterium]|nr:DUF971 domain-containing protein [Ignavibacteriaceae bacterium]